MITVPEAPSRARATRVAVRHGSPGGPCRVDLGRGLLAPQLLDRNEHAARIALVSTMATLLAGDQLDIEVHVEAGLRLDLVDVAATVAHHGRGGPPARIRLNLVVDRAATLVWEAEPLVVCHGADVARITRVEVAEGARLLLRDRIVLGRHREAAGSLSCRTRIALGNRPALAEDLELAAPALPEQGGRTTPRVLGANTVMDTVTAVGWQPTRYDDPDAPSVFELAVPGAVARLLRTETHQSSCTPLWASWQSQLAGRS